MYIQRELTLNFEKKLCNKKEVPTYERKKNKMDCTFKSRQSVAHLNYVTASAKSYGKYEKGILWQI